jgi:predicted transcriptional regulator
MWRGDRFLSPQTPLTLAAQTFFGVERGRVLPVVDQGYLLGTLSLEQLHKITPAKREQVSVEKVMSRRGSLLGLRPEDDLQSSMKTLSAKPAVYGAVIGEGGQFAGLLYLSDVPRFLEMQQLLGPLDHKVEPFDLPATPIINNQDETTEDNVGGPPQPQKLDKVA